MPCSCGAVRIIRQKVLCPKCESIVLLDPKPRIEAIEKCLEDATGLLDEILQTVSPEFLVVRLVIEREIAAMRCLSQVSAKSDAVKRWLSISYLLSKYPWKGIGSPRSSFVEYLIFAGEEILEYENVIHRLRKKLAEVVLIDGKEEIVPTEFDVLYTIPSGVLEQYEQQLLLTKVIVEKEDSKSFDVSFVRETMLQPRFPLIIGDDVFRQLKRNYSHRILPFMSPSNASDFIKISLKIAGFIAFQLGRDFGEHFGLLETDTEYLEGMKAIIIDELSEKATWCFKQLENPSRHPAANLGETIIIKTIDDTVFLPYFSIYLLAHLCLRWEKSSEKGEYYRYIGETVEDIVFSFVSAYSVNTNHPINGKPLLRIPHPERQGEEIADIMAYDSSNLIVVESKFREILTIKDLEIELTKFQEKIKYIKANMLKFGFSNGLQIRPFFYVPYPPYVEWNGIKLIPSLVLLGTELTKFCKPRPIELVPRSQELQNLLQKIKDATPYPTDLSIIDSSVPQNIYRIQDGVVESYDEEEITILIDNPVGIPTILIVDISEEIYKELLANKVGKGDVIKMALVNLNNTWTMIQMVEFKTVGRVTSSRDDLDIYGLHSILRINSGEHAIEKIVFQTWGEETGKELLEVLKKWNISLPSFIQHQLEKGQNVLIAVGKLLQMATTFSTLLQCKCGEVMEFPSSEALEIFKSVSPAGIQCEKCDPGLLKRLEKNGHPLKKIDDSTMFEYRMRHQKEKT